MHGDWATVQNLECVILYVLSLKAIMACPLLTLEAIYAKFSQKTNWRGLKTLSFMALFHNVESWGRFDKGP